MHWGNSCVPNNVFVSSFTLFSVVGSFIGSDPKKIVIAYETLLVIAETDALEIP